MLCVEGEFGEAPRHVRKFVGVLLRSNQDRSFTDNFILTSFFVFASFRCMIPTKVPDIALS